MAWAQSKISTRGQSPSVIERLPVPFAGVALAAFVLTAVLLTAHSEVLSGDLIDTDSYMHLVRLRAVIADGSWHGGYFPRDNAPFGMILHCSKAYDLIVLGLAAPLAAFAGWQRALVWVAPMIGPLATWALILAGVWAAAPICDVRERRLAGIVLVLAPLVLGYGSIGDADHHVMVVAAWAIFMGFALRVAMGGVLRHDVVDALVACFPAGTLSGAPKVRAMEIIDELETERRDLYGGAVGYFASDGSIDTCIVVCTAVVKDAEMVVQSGCGVVADSDPATECQEILEKARALFRAPAEAVRFARR